MKIFHIFILILLFVVVGCQEESGLNENEVVEEGEVVVLFVNGVPITEKEIEEYKEVIVANTEEDLSEEEIYEAAIQDAIMYEIRVQYLEEKEIEVTEEDIVKIQMRILHTKLTDELEITEEEIEERYSIYKEELEEEGKSIVSREEAREFIVNRITEETVQEKIDEVERITEELATEKSLDEANKEAIFLVTRLDLGLSPAVITRIGLGHRVTELREKVEVTEEEITERYQKWEKVLEDSDSEKELLPLEEVTELVHREIAKDKAAQMMHEEIIEKKEMAEIEIME